MKYKSWQFTSTYTVYLYVLKDYNIRFHIRQEVKLILHRSR
jgi:hypothetical protein